MSSFLPSGLSSYECRLFYLLDCLAPNVVFLWFQSFQTNMMNMMRLEISMRRIGRKKYSSKYKKSEQNKVFYIQPNRKTTFQLYIGVCTLYIHTTFLLHITQLYGPHCTIHNIFFSFVIYFILFLAPLCKVTVNTKQSF